MKLSHSTIQQASRSTMLIWGLVILGFISQGVSGHTATAQENSASAKLASAKLTAARDKMYDQLAKDAKQIELFTGALKKVFYLTKPTVVHIEAVKINDSGRRVEEAGSGVIIQRKGKFYVITNRHVIHASDKDKIKIKLATGKAMFPSKVWEDPDTDIAVMQVKQSNLIAARVGNSKKTDIGDLVLAVGSPFGLSHSITFGIVSAKGRHDLELGSTEKVKIQNFIQTDAAINPGNSGGPLFNLRGELIGINTAIASNTGGNNGIGFSIPINMVSMVAGQLIDNGKVNRGFLGVNMDERYTLRASSTGLPMGAKVFAVTPNSPAEQYKLRKDDLILSFNGTRIESDKHLFSQVGITPVGREVPIEILRANNKLNLKIKIGNRSEFEKEQN